MGGGASSMGLEEVLTTTYVLGRAIAAITFPGMYRIYDFHSAKAPKLKNARQFTFFADDSDDEDESESSTAVDPAQYEHFFCVTVGEDKIYIENPVEQNEAGWTPLHACCMSFLTVNAAFALIEETVRQGGNLDAKTIAGPGTFNRNWTALHMACAYGVEPIVEKLIAEGADVNTVNSFGYTPLLEACHRGFLNVAQFLVKGGADLRYIPPEEVSASSPFVSAPAQSALGEAARCGFSRIVQLLLDAGAPKDQSNALAWTPLHEACFYNRIDTVKTLMLSGADASLRTRNGAMAYHLAGLQIIRDMLRDMGGQDAVPVPGDEVDMVAILRELTMSDATIIYADENGNVQVSEARDSHSHSRMITDDEGSERKSHSQQSTPSHAVTKKNHHSAERKQLLDDDEEGKDAGEPALLHSGPMLGNLPSLGGKQPGRSPQGRAMRPDINVDKALQYGEGAQLSMVADGKDSSVTSAGKKKKNKNGKEKYKPPADMPKEYLCQLSQRPMSEPVRSVYGHVFEKRAITDWLNTQGKICPLTGAPLVETDLKPLDDLAKEIREWILAKSRAKEGEPDSSSAGGSNRRLEQPNPDTPVEVRYPTTSPGSKVSAPVNTGPEDDLYDF